MCLNVRIVCVGVSQQNENAWTMDPRFRDADQDKKKMTSLEAAAKAAERRDYA